jgi:hypothetical protein
MMDSEKPMANSPDQAFSEDLFASQEDSEDCKFQEKLTKARKNRFEIDNVWFRDLC